MMTRILLCRHPGRWLTVFIGLGLVLRGAELDRIFRSGMVLQRDAKVRIYGNGPDGEEVSIELKGQAKSAVVRQGEWEVFLDPIPADRVGAALVLRSKSAQAKLEGVLIGDVWLLGGQSNMYRGFGAYPTLAGEMRAINDPTIRALLIEPNIPPTTKPTRTFKTRFGSTWTTLVYGRDRETDRLIQELSPIGYFFARELVLEKGVPVGLIMACLGSTAAQCWVPQEVLVNQPALRHYFKADKAIAPGTPRPHMLHTSWLYNGVIHPITRFTIKGFLWYQGESNAKEPEEYRILFPELIRAWRQAWAEGDVPFIFAQLASYGGVKWDRSAQAWAFMRESQMAALSLPNTGMVTLIDTGEIDNIHPADKQVAGHRFYLKARAVAYGEDIVSSGPVYSSARFEADAVVISFANTGAGLVVKESRLEAGHQTEKVSRPKLAGFSVCCTDGNFVPADAEIISPDSVRIWSKQITKPAAVRYAWENYSLANLYNLEGFPCEPFRTDRFPAR